MKKAVVILITIFASTSFVAFAQHKDSPVKNLYEKYEENSSMNSIYVTSKMLELRLGQKGANVEQLEISNLIKNFNALILVGSEGEQPIPETEIKALRKIIKDRSYEQVVRMSEGGESLTVYVLEDSKSNKINDFIVIALEDNEQMLLSISGNLSMQEIGMISQMFNLDVMGFLKL